MRGKVFHNTIAKQADDILTADDWQVQWEYRHRQNNITTYLDLYAVKGEKRMGFEIETTPRHALDNVAKAILTGIDLCIIVPTRKIGSQIEQQLASSLPENIHRSISVILLSQLKAKLIEINEKHSL